MLFTIGLIATGVVLVYVYLTWNFNYWKDRGVLGPKPIPVIGSFPGVFSRKRSAAYEINDVYK